jgi:uncharacterized membrane protein YvbJ
MVYCVKCGAKNEDDAEVCVKCGAPLHGPKRVTTRRENTCFGPRGEKRFEEECFGLPYGGAIFGILFGIIILILGVAWIIERDVWKYMGPLMVIVIGILIIAGIAYRFSRRY